MQKFKLLLLLIVTCFSHAMAESESYKPLAIGNYWTYVAKDTIGGGCQSPKGLNGSEYFLPSSSSYASGLSSTSQSKDFTRYEITKDTVMEGTTWYLQKSCSGITPPKKCDSNLEGSWIRFDGTRLIQKGLINPIQNFESTITTQIDTVRDPSSGSRFILVDNVDSNDPKWTRGTTTTTTINANVNNILSQNMKQEYWHAGVGLIYSYQSQQSHPDANPTFIRKEYLCFWNVDGSLAPIETKSTRTTAEPQTWKIFDLRGQLLGQVQGDSKIKAQNAAQSKWPHQVLYLQ